MDSDGSDGGSFNVLIPIVIPRVGAQHMKFWDEVVVSEADTIGADRLVGRYKFKNDEGIILGEDVLHATCVSSEIRLMLGLCVQDKKGANKTKNNDWIDPDAFPHPKKDKGYISKIQGTHYNEKDPGVSLHAKESRREIYSFLN